MDALLPILIFVVGVVAILILEIGFKTHPVTEAIRPWQGGLGALLGFVSLALSVQMNATATQHIQRIEREAAGRQLALALHAEALPLLSRLIVVTTSASTGSAITKRILAEFDEKTLQDTTLNIRCSGGKKQIRPVRPIGVFEANKANLGLLPGQLAYLFVDFHQHWAELNDRIEALTDGGECTAELQRAIEVVEISANIVVVSMKLIDAEYRRLRIPAAWVIQTKSK